MEELFRDIERYLARGERPPLRMAEYLAEGLYDAESLVQACAWLLGHQDSPELRVACLECAAESGKLRFAQALNAGEGTKHLVEMTEDGPGVWPWALESASCDAANEALGRAARIFDELVDRGTA